MQSIKWVKSKSKRTVLSTVTNSIPPFTIAQKINKKIGYNTIPPGHKSLCVENIVLKMSPDSRGRINGCGSAG